MVLQQSLNGRLESAIGIAAAQNPVLIQSRHGHIGNFEMVVPVASGGLAHYFRDNDAPGFPWYLAATFGIGRVEAISLIESNLGEPSNLEVIARIGTQLFSYYRDLSGWQGPFPIHMNGKVISGNPALIQSQRGHRGNFELVIPLASGGIVHFFRDNDTPGFPWHLATTFGAERVEAISMIESNFGHPGNLEVVARIGTQLFTYFHEATGWQGPFPINMEGMAVSGNPVLVQGRHGNRGNFELVAPLVSGGLVHYYRDNDSPGFQWHCTTAFGREQIEAVSLIESRFTHPGNLEVIARVGTQLFSYYRNSGCWQGPFPIVIANIHIR